MTKFQQLYKDKTMSGENEEYDETKVRMKVQSWKNRLEQAAKTNNYEEFALAAKNLTPSQMFEVRDSDGRNVFQMSLRFAENGDITNTAAYQYITQRNPDWDASDKIARAAYRLDDHNYSILSYLNEHTKDSGGVAATLLKLKEHLDLNPRYQVSDAYKDYFDQLLFETRQPMAYGYNRQKKQEADEYIESYPEQHHDAEFAATVAKNERKYGKVGAGAPRLTSRDGYE